MSGSRDIAEVEDCKEWIDPLDDWPCICGPRLDQSTTAIGKFLGLKNFESLELSWNPVISFQEFLWIGFPSLESLSLSLLILFSLPYSPFYSPLYSTFITFFIFLYSQFLGFAVSTQNQLSKGTLMELPHVFSHEAA